MTLCSWTLAQSQDTSTLFRVEQDAEAVLNTEEKRFYDRLDESFILEKSLLNLTRIAAAVQNQRQEIHLRNENRGLQRVRVSFQITQTSHTPADSWTMKLWVKYICIEPAILF
ncbi:hypothetical protein BH23BAC3_BH23BAC3_23670 [soil metagenome]